MQIKYRYSWIVIFMEKGIGYHPGETKVCS